MGRGARRRASVADHLAFNDISDSDPAATFSTAVRELDRLGLAYLHMVEPGPADPVGPGPRLDAAFFRPLWRTALVANKAYDLARANAVLCGRPGRSRVVRDAVLANPDLPERFRRGAAFNPPDRKTFYGGAAPGYTDYPALLP